MPISTAPHPSVAPPLPSPMGLIAADLAEAERIFAAELESSSPYVRELIAHLSHYRGKRLRPALLLLSARACGRVAPAHHVLAAVVEMIHTATLVHDDVLDNAALRRHMPTVHARWGNATSVLLGDLLFTHAFYLASTTGSTVACRLIGEATNRVCEGELHQIGERGNLSLNEDEYAQMIRGKTAALTACCCRLGALFSGAADATVEALARYGCELGMAFQIADDVLDLVGHEEAAGKSLGTDLAEQKLTLPLIRLLDQVGPERAATIRRLFSSPLNHKRDKLASYLRETDAVAYATRRAEEHARHARQELHGLPPSESRQGLEDLTYQVVSRRA